VKLIETLKLALAAIWAHKLRSTLTLLGMIVGVTAFVVVVSLIQGFDKYIDEKIAGIGSKSFTVQRFNFEDFKNVDTIAAAQRRNKELTLEDLEYLKSRLLWWTRSAPRPPTTLTDGTPRSSTNASRRGDAHHSGDRQCRRSVGPFSR
jgi:hypothetical protein